MKRIFCGIVIFIISSFVILPYGLATDKIDILNKKQTLFLAGVEMYLGMDKDKILESINKIYTARRHEELDLYTITEGEGSNIRPLGYIQFIKGKLNNAMKSWGDFRADDGYNFAQTILSAIIQMNNEWKYTVNTRTHTIRQPGKILNTIYIYYGRKQIHIGVNEQEVRGRYIKSMSVQEYLWNN